ncbi:MAG: hypothetical protein ACFE9T_06065 [Promethearchaeota archaeon]
MIVEYHKNKELKDKIKQSREKESEDEKVNVNIWKINPSYNDIENGLAVAKLIFIVLLFEFILCSIYILTFDLILALGAGIVIIILFIIVFHDQFFGLSPLFAYTFRRFSSFNPFQKMVFWQENIDSTTVYISNKQDLTHIGIRIFKIEVIPENVHAVMEKFIRSLSEGKLLAQYTYQVVQNPYYNKSFRSREVAMQSQNSISTSIYFSISYRVKGVLSKKILEQLKYKLGLISHKVLSDFRSNFYHYKIGLLSSTELIKALRLNYIKEGAYYLEEEEKPYIFEKEGSFVLAKLLFCSVLVFTCDFLLFLLNVLFGYILLFNLSLLAIISLLWWRELFFQFSKKKLTKNNEITLIAPFRHICFYRFRHHPDTLFLHVNETLLIGLKLFNLIHAFPPNYGSTDKFYQAIISQKIPFTYTMSITPISYYRFFKEGFKYLDENLREKILHSNKKWERIESPKDEFNWLNERSGMWKAMLILSSSAYMLVDSFKIKYILNVEKELRSNAEAMRQAFQMNFMNMELAPLQKRKLVSGYLYETLKNRFFRLNGSHMKYLLFQGKILKKFTYIVDILKKGIETRIAAEFNTPTHLQNFITIGHTINTEVLEEEVPLGLLLEQLKNLLITSGTSKSRELLCMKIVSELIKVNIPSIIFDFYGTWSRLIKYFKNSQYEDDLLYFKLGTTFTLDPLYSDIPYDKNNPAFLEYIYNSYALAFKKDARTVDIFRTTIQRNPEMDLPSLNLEIINQREWEKRPMTDSLVNLFSDFTQEDLSHFFSSQKTFSNSISPLEFISNNKTIIIDLSISNDYKKQLFFTFIIISKFLHYIGHSREFTPKILFIPHIDLFFNNSYIEQRTNYGIINTFLDSLIHNDFGLIFSANQIHSIHPNLFKYLTNQLTFRATDSRDIAVLKNQMNLQELVGRGYYTSTRNNTYQIDYLMNLKDNEVIVKRDDINQPFPGRIKWDDLKQIPSLGIDEMVLFMKQQGYDVKSTEQRILQQAEPTIFQMDLGSYIIYLDEIQKFLTHLKTVDQIGNLYEKKITQELKQYVAPKAKKRNYTNADIVNLVNKLFSILIKHGYLVESHPKKAGGSESMRTSYSVGDKFEIAVEDYYKAKTGISVDILEKDSEHSVDYSKILQEKHRTHIVRQEDLKEAFAREISNFSYDIYKIFKFINHGEFKSALKVEHNLLRQFFMKIYQHFYNVNYVITSNDLQQFIKMIASSPDIPFTLEELIDYMERYRDIHFDIIDLEATAREIYLFYSEFFQKIQQYAYNQEVRE